MAPPYKPHLETLLIRAIFERLVADETEFKTRFAEEYAAISRAQDLESVSPDGAAEAMYKVELVIFGALWSNEPFPGQDPSMRYLSKLRMMFDRAVKEGDDAKERFIEIWKQEEDIKKLDPESDESILQFEMEKRIWLITWGDTGEEFPGVDPRTMH